MKEHIAEVQDELDTLVKIIVEAVPTERIYLFGSYAYGTPHKDSDLDIYIVMKDDAPMREWDAMDAVNFSMYRRVHKPCDILALKKNRFDDRSTGPTMERKIVREGVKIYG